MKLHVDLETLQLIEGPGFRNPVTSLRFKRGDAARLEVSFLESGTNAVAIGDPGTLEIRFGIKPRNRYDVGYLVHHAVWTMPAADAENPVYQCSPSFNTSELDSALGVGSSTGSELSEITLMGEITWREGDGEPTSTRTFMVIVENDVNRGTEGVPVSAQPAYPAPDSLVTMSNIGEKAVRHDVAQSITPTRQAQARGNIGLQPLAPLLQSTITSGQVPRWDGTNWTPQDPPGTNYWSYDDGGSYAQFESAFGSTLLRFSGQVGGSGSYLAAINIYGEMMSGGQIGAYNYNLWLNSGYAIHLDSYTTVLGGGWGSNHGIGPAGSDVICPYGTWNFSGATGLSGGRSILPPTATDLPSAITLLNAIRTLLGNSTGYALADL